MKQTDPLLSIHELSLVRGQRAILDNITLEIEPGEIVTIVGPNGAGKTTLLRAALGLLAATSGKVIKQSGVRVGYMPQRLHLDQTLPLTVERFLRLTKRYSGELCLPCLQEVGAEKLCNARIQELSGGELQRVLLARALMGNPELLVLDEPIQGVDIHGQAELYRLLTELRDRRGCAILMVSHDLHLVMASTDRVVCLNHHVCCTGSPESVANNPAFLHLFGAKVVESLAFYSHSTTHRHQH